MSSTFGNFLKRSGLVFAAMLLACSLPMPVSLLVIDEAKAESSRSGVILGGTRHYQRKYAGPAHKRAAKKRLGYRKSGSLGHGKRYTKKRYGKYGKRYHHYKRGDFAFIDRRRRIEAYNRSIRKQRAGVIHSTAPGVASVYAPLERQGIITSGYSDTGVAGPVIQTTEPCPARHNCGYRLYDDGTGPRIITPGVSAGKDLPPFDGLSGPRVITPNG